MTIKKKWIIYIISFFIIASILFFSIYFYQKNLIKEIKDNTQVSEIQKNREKSVIVVPVIKNLKETQEGARVNVLKFKKNKHLFPERECIVETSPIGKIYLSLKKADQDDNSVDIYSFDIKNKKFERVFDYVSYSRSQINFFDNNKAIFVSSDENSLKDKIVIYNFSNKTQKNIPFYKDGNISAPVFSPNGKNLAFVLSPRKSGSLAEESMIYLIDKKGNIKLMISGSKPSFSPDGKFLLILRNPGLYIVNLETQELERVVELIDENQNIILGQRNHMISLSDDGKLLAWSNIDRREVYLFNIYSWNPFEYTINNIFNMSAFWSTFSPDGKYFAIQTVESNVETITNSKLTIYETCRFNEIFSVNLNEFDQNFLWVNDWLK